MSEQRGKITLRVPRDLLDRLYALANEMAAPNQAPNRNATAVTLLARAINAAERKRDQ
jgi:hypothetical protein